MCDDHGKKGWRAGFRFVGDDVFYNCFNCGYKAGYVPEEHKRIPKKMFDLLLAFDIPQTELVKFTNYTTDPSQSNKPVFVEPQHVTFPTYFYPLADADDKIAIIAYDFLERRKLPTDYPYMLCEKNDNPIFKRWHNRLIIPSYKDGKCIHYQGRALFGDDTHKYLTSPGNHEGALFGFDRLHEQSETPLFITEGIFDAMLLKGVAVFGNAITAPKQKWINTSYREKVVVLDKEKSSYNLAETAAKYGWGIACPDIGTATDVNSSVIKYGLLYTLDAIYKNIYYDVEGLTNAKIYCNEGK